MSHSDGYVRITVNGKRVYKHRYVARLFWPEVEQVCGDGDPRYCGRIVSWDLSPPNPAALVVDHLDHNRKNNAIWNLMPCCSKCNTQRKVTRAQLTAR